MAIDAATLRIGVGGFFGVLGADLRRWFGRRGLFHLILWVAGINGFVYSVVATANMPFGPLGYENLLNALMLFPVFAGIILAEATVVGEYRDGVASWLISKPVTRGGYVAAKLGGLWIGLSVVAILIPGLVANWWLPKVEPYRFVTPDAPPFGRFIVALGVTMVVLGFFIAVTGFLSVVIRRRGPVALFAMILWLVLRFAPPQIRPSWYRYLPTGLFKADLDVNSWIPGMEYINGNAFDPVSAVWATVAVVALLVAGSMVFYRRLEL
ncbi:MAG: ABC transporter permease [Actinomycetia bacterium]|nr:ABC transporter permease [Actinomycetes bacterium]